MKVRRQGGATLGLVAACVFLVIVIGVGFYFLSKIIGGGREVANATDAGALQVARQALVRGTVDISNPAVVANTTGFGGVTDTALAEFSGCVVQPSSGPANSLINLVTYNRVVAQAMIVAQNAVLENTPASTANAVATCTLANEIGAALANSLNTTSIPGLQRDFTAMAGNANTKMWNGNPVSCTTLAGGTIKPNGSTNVIFDTASLAALSGGSPWSPTGFGTGNNPPQGGTDVLGAAIGAGSQFLPGYAVNTFALNGGTSVSLSGVPVFPNTKPHLIDVGTFNADSATINSALATASNAGPNTVLQNTPPNCFNAGAQAIEAKSGGVGGSLACAVVGVLTQDFKASLPRGFIRIVNGQDAATGTNGNPALGTPVSDGSNDIFANQLMGTGIFQDPNNGGAPQTPTTQQEVFTTTPAYLTLWSDFNNRNTAAGWNNLASYPNVASQVAFTTAYVVQDNSGGAYSVTDSVTGIMYNVYPVGAFVSATDLPTSTTPSLQDMSANPATYDAGEGGLRAGAVCNQYASPAQLQGIGLAGNPLASPCVYSDFGTPGNPSYVASPCSNISGGNPTYAVYAWEQNYMCIGSLPNASAFIGSQGNGAPQNQGVTNVEYMKEELLVNIAGRLGGTYCADITIPSAQPSGVKYFPHGTPGSGGSAEAFDPTPGYAGGGGASQYVNFETVATPFMYLQQITNGSGSSLGSCGQGSATSIVGQITARLQQIDSTVTAAQVSTALNTPGMNLHLQNSGVTTENDNGTLYLYVDPSTHTVTMNTLASLPSGFTDGGAAADGPSPASAGTPGECTEQYPLDGWVVDTKNTITGDGPGYPAGGDPKGDAHYHDQPFTQPGLNGASPAYGSTGPGTWSTTGAAVSNSPNLAGTQHVNGQDAAIFTQSSGFQNLLGVLNFTENVQGTTFCRPN